MATSVSKIEDFYRDCMNCSNTPKKCKGVLKNSQKGDVPRGFFFKSPSIDILVVGKNPGHALPGEKNKYKGKNDFELFNAFRNHQKLYEDLNNLKDGSLRFHKNLFRYLRFLQDIEDENVSSIYKKYAHTNLVKCSTVGEQDKLKKSTIDICYDKYFTHEVKLFNPIIILALGREVEQYLLKKRSDHKVEHVFYIKHPSRPYKKEDENSELLKIKRKIIKIIAAKSQK
jgi:uracil-DNA glycosylase